MHSQGYEEKWIADYFGSTGIFVDGRQRTFLDIGANDAKTLSNTRALWEKGWAGVLAEASPTAYHKLCENVKGRTDTVTIEGAIWSHDGIIPFHESGTHLKKGDHALLSSAIERETTKWRPTTEFKEIQVHAMTVATLLSRVAYKTFDFISIDIEGFDLMALRQMDLTAMGCRCLIVEVNNNPIKGFHDHAEGVHGMKYVRRNAENAMYIRDL